MGESEEWTPSQCPKGRPSGPPEQHPQPSSRPYNRVARTESLRSERSDKRRVSFNQDVGVKHIPRGHKGQQPVRASPLPPPPPDEWAKCSQVHREPVALSSRELEQEAEELVKLIDYVDCDAKGNSYNRSRSTKRRNKNNPPPADATPAHVQ